MSTSFIDAMQFPIQDRNWLTKLGITGVLMFIPILGWLIIYGYGLRLIRNVQSGFNELPEYDDFGGDLSRGFTAILGSLVYLIPSIIISCCQSIIGQNSDGSLNALGCLLSLISIGYSIAITPILYSAVARFAQEEQIGVFLDFGGRVNDVMTHIGDSVMLYINVIILGIIGSIAIGIGLVLCCIPGILAAGGYYLATSHLIAQWGIILGVGSGMMGKAKNMGSDFPSNIEPLS